MGYTTKNKSGKSDVVKYALKTVNDSFGGTFCMNSIYCDRPHADGPGIIIENFAILKSTDETKETDETKNNELTGS